MFERLDNTQRSEKGPKSAMAITWLCPQVDDCSEVWPARSPKWRLIESWAFPGIVKSFPTGVDI